METTTVPATIAPEAAAHVAALGFQREFDQMLDYIRQSVPGLRSITVTLAPPYDTGDEFCVLIEALTDNPHLPYDPAEREWEKWTIQAYAPDVYRHFVLLTVYGPES